MPARLLTLTLVTLVSFSGWATAHAQKPKKNDTKKGSSAVASAAPSASPPVKLEIETGLDDTGKFTLRGPDASQQLVVSGLSAKNDRTDVTRAVTYTSSPSGIVEIGNTGLVVPLKEGATEITAKLGNVQAKVPCVVTAIAEPERISFHNQIVPVFSKLGCNTGGCHGKADGQNGFKLSLFGFEPQEDHDYVVTEGHGRRLFPSAPTLSLLLRKATASVPHGGGKRMDVDAPYYQLVQRWIEQGSPKSPKTEPEVVRLEVFPNEQSLGRAKEQQLSVLAHLSDGSRMDVTRLALFESTSSEMAEVTPTGLIKTQDRPGSFGVMVRFHVQVAVFRGTIPLGAPVDNLPASKNFVDELVFGRLKTLGLPPSVLTDDGTFLRRVTVDIAGRLPTRSEVEEFVADSSEKKYEAVVDRLLESPEYADYFANKWSAVLRNRRKAAGEDTKPTFAFHAWIRDALKDNMPFDRFVREVLTASGEAVKTPPVIWYREVRDASAQLEDVAQLFLGQRIACARCHHHPYEKWSQHDYYSLSAFFSQITVKDPPPPKKPKKGEPEIPAEPFQVVLGKQAPKATNPKTNTPVKPAGLGADPLDIKAGDDARDKLADWMTDKSNPFFSKMLANRYWKHFLGRGLVEPEDDMRVTNPPTNPELLEALAKHFTDSKYDLRSLVRIICTSNTYRLSTIPNEHNAGDQQSYSRFLPKRLSAEVLLDAIDEVTATKTTFKGVDGKMRAVQLPDNQFESYFLTVFGRPDAATACECERSSSASLAQSLHLINSSEVLGKVSGTRAKSLAGDKRTVAERIRELYLVAVSREPSAAELENLTSYVEGKTNKQTAFEDVIWALINTKEFQFNH